MYRQWQEVDSNGKIPNTGSINAQKVRLNKTVECIQKSRSEAETIILADTNINTQKISAPQQEKSHQDKQTSQVSKIFSNSILQAGFTVLNHLPTHKTSTIDHIISSEPIKMANITTINTHYSDHQLVVANRLTKTPTRVPRYTSSRAYSKIDYEEMKNEIKSDPRLAATLRLNDPDNIAANIIEIIRNQLDTRAPLRRIQTTSKKVNMSTETAELMRQRDSAWMEHQNDPTPDNLRDYRHKKNSVKKSLIQDKIKQDKNMITDAANSKDQWAGAMKAIGWTTYGGPRTLIKDGVPITSPKEMARILNMDYITRTAKAARNTPHSPR